jgi:hypothetical protein
MGVAGNEPVRARRTEARGPATLQWVWLAALTGAALVVRLYQLATPALRWDEGWSLAHATLPWSQLAKIALADRHPPLYFALLKLWLATGRSTWGLRFLSVIPGVLAVPLMYHAARAWLANGAACALRNSAFPKSRVSSLVPLLAAAFACFWPLLVYYGQVARMYSWSALWVLGAAWCALAGSSSEVGAGQDAESLRRHARRQAAIQDVGLVLCSAASLYTLYHTAWAIAGLWLYALIVQPRRFRRLFLLGFAVLLFYAPWLFKAVTTLQQRLGTPVNAPQSLQDWLRLLVAPIEGLAFVQGSGRKAELALGLVLAAGLVLGRPSRADAQRLLLPVLVLAFSVLGVAVGSQQLWFAPRHLVPATPFLGLALAWALDRLRARWWPVLAVALLGLVLVYWSAGTHFVYQKTLEVTEAFDPTTDYRYLAENAGPEDLVYFNALATAGWYENLRRPQDPAWSYAMRWEPIIEPVDEIAARIQRDSQTHERLWFVFYKGDYGPNAALIAWLNEQLYPAGSAWQRDTLYLAYVAPSQPQASQPRGDQFSGGIRLGEARWTPNAAPGGAVAVTLVWQADRLPPESYKVFVHLVDASGRVVAQHDGLPDSGARPTETWAVGEQITDRHGLFLLADASLPLSLRVGLYSAQTGERLLLTDGSDAVHLGSVAGSPWALTSQ